MKKTYCYIHNDEPAVGDYPSREAAIEDCIYDLNLKLGDMLETGACVPVKVEELTPSACEIIDHMGEVAIDEIGEAAEDWLAGLTKEQMIRLQGKIDAAIYDWLLEIDELPTFCRVTNVKEHIVTEKDLDNDPE